MPAHVYRFPCTLSLMMQTRSLILSVAAVVLTACGGSAYQEPSAPSLLSSSSYSSSAPSSFSGPSSPSIPSHDTRGELVVRPDLVCVPFVLRLEGAEAKATLASLEKASEAVQARFSAATKGQSTMKMLGVNVRKFATGKAKTAENDEPLQFVITVDGSVEVPLGDGNYWDRARLLSSLVEASHDSKPLIPPAPEEQPQLDAAFGAPEVKVRDPEAHRAELVKRWVERTRTFAKAAESEKAQLNVVNCDPPNAIAQNVISVEQVGLSLSVQCRIDVVRAAP